MTVRIQEYLPLHPASSQLAQIDRELAALNRSRLVGASTITAIANPQQAEAPPTEAHPSVGMEGQVDLQRAEADVRAEYAARREGAAPPIPAAPRVVPEPPPPAEEQPAARPPEPERSTGLDEEISQLNQQLERLKERPQDRLLYTAAQLRRRRELLDSTRAEIQRLHQLQVDRLRSSLRSQSATNQRRRPAPIPVRRPNVPKVRPPDPALMAAEQKELETLRSASNLPAPEPPLVTGTAPDSHQPARDQVTAALASNKKPGAMPREDVAAYGKSLEARRTSLREMLLDELHAAAASAAREHGWELTTGSGGRDATSELRSEVQAMLAGRGAGAGR